MVEKEELIRIVLEDVERILRNHQDIVINVNRSESNMDYSQGFPQPLPTQITEIYTITSTFKYNP